MGCYHFAYPDQEFLRPDYGFMMGNKSFVFRFADVEVREREFSLLKAGKVLAVEPKAFRVLLLLLRNPQKLLSKEELLNSVWGDTAVTEGSLTRSIWLLRRLLGDDVNEPRFIETVATVGYRLVCKMEVSETASGDLQATDKANGLIEGDVVETPAKVEIAEARGESSGADRQANWRHGEKRKADRREARQAPGLAATRRCHSRRWPRQCNLVFAPPADWNARPLLCQLR
jgi:DNA-binding winged helix-turn-helix (wHTH) protein